MDGAVDGQTTSCPLTEVVAGSSIRIVEIGAGPEMVRRCLALGLGIGAEVTVQRRRGRGVVVANDGNRVALGAEIAEHIMTEPLA